MAVVFPAGNAQHPALAVDKLYKRRFVVKSRDADNVADLIPIEAGDIGQDYLVFLAIFELVYREEFLQ